VVSMTTIVQTMSEVAPVYYILALDCKHVCIYGSKWSDVDYKDRNVHLPNRS